MSRASCIASISPPSRAQSRRPNQPPPCLNCNSSPKRGSSKPERKEIRFQFSLSESDTKEPKADLADVVVVASQVGGNWSQRVLAESVGGGVYEFRLTIPQAGNYAILFTIPSVNIEIGQLPQLGIEVIP